MLKNSLQNIKKAFDATLQEEKFDFATEDIGRILSITGPVARTGGLQGVQAEEMVQAEDGTLGIVAGLDRRGASIILLDTPDSLAAGSEVKRLGRVADVPVGPDMLGRVIDATGSPLDEKKAPASVARLPIERPAPKIMERAPVTEPLQTGIKVVDALIPIGKGQRELILGDRQTGKTSIALDTIANQKDKNVVCIYAAIGQRESAIAKVMHDLRVHGAMEYTVIVASSGQDAPGLQYITPYAATTIGEYFMAQGRDVLIVYDDLTRHARAYREISLLLERAPGREAYPGDIFYIHSRLLERSTRLRKEFGAGSLTALPIVETEAQNLSAYIPTNIISITDGQLYLSPDLFAKGVLPAVDVGKSVSRVGGKAQRKAQRDLAGKLRLSYSQFEELETFARFATRLDETTRSSIERGKRLRAILQQKRFHPLTDYEQVAVLFALNLGLFDSVPVEAVKKSEKMIAAHIAEGMPQLCSKISSGQPLEEEDKEDLHDFLQELLAE